MHHLAFIPIHCACPYKYTDTDSKQIIFIDTTIHCLFVTRIYECTQLTVYIQYAMSKLQKLYIARGPVVIAEVM